MIRASHPSKNSSYVKVTCSDGNVFAEGCIEDCYDEAMAHERKLMKQFLSQHVNVVYDIMQDPEKNEDNEYEDLADLLGAPEYTGSRLPIYVLKPKPNADFEYVAEAVKSWYQYLVIELQANWLLDDIPDLDTTDFTKYECIETKFDHSLRFNNAYVIVAQCSPSSTTIWLTLSTIQDEVYNYHRRIDILSKEQAEFIDLGERVVDVGIKLRRITMITASHFKDRPEFASFECSDGKVFEVDYEKVYNDALTHEYRCCKEQLAKYVDVTYNAMKDPAYNKDDQYTSLDNFMNDHIDYGDSMILYVMKPKVGADHDAVFKACRAWYDYLIVTQEANHMYDIATSVDKMAECENIHIPNLQLKSDDAYVIKATCNINYGTITLQLTTLQVELKLKHAEVMGIKKEYDDYEHLNELTKDVGLD